MTERIDIVPIKMPKQVPTEVRECYINLCDTYIEFICKMFADEPKDNDDDKLGFQSVYNSYETFALRKNIAGVEKSYTKEQYWAVAIAVNGFIEDIKVYFKFESQASELHEKVKTWLLSTIA